LTVRKSTVQKKPLTRAAAAPAAPMPERLADDEHTELRAAFAAVAEARARADAALGEMRDAEAVANYLMRRIGARYGLAEGDRIEDDGAITRVPAPTAVGE
jgi:hypothetical protein